MLATSFGTGRSLVPIVFTTSAACGKMAVYTAKQRCESIMKSTSKLSLHLRTADLQTTLATGVFAHLDGTELVDCHIIQALCKKGGGVVSPTRSSVDRPLREVSKHAEKTGYYPTTQAHLQLNPGNRSTCCWQSRLWSDSRCAKQKIPALLRKHAQENSLQV